MTEATKHRIARRIAERFVGIIEGILMQSERAAAFREAYAAALEVIESAHPEGDTEP